MRPSRAALRMSVRRLCRAPASSVRHAEASAHVKRSTCAGGATGRVLDSMAQLYARLVAAASAVRCRLRVMLGRESACAELCTSEVPAAMAKLKRDAVSGGAEAKPDGHVQNSPCGTALCQRPM